MKKKELLRRIEVLEKRYAAKEEKALLEPKKELEVGKWYKCKGESKFLAIHLLESRYGFDCEGEWFSEHNDDVLVYHKDYIEATPQEVEKALIEEAKVRYKVGDKIYFKEDLITCELDLKSLSFISHENTLYCSYNNWSGSCLIFKNGKWADVIKNDDKPQVGDVCKFWDENESEFIIDVLNSTDCTSHPYNTRNGLSSINAKKLTEQEVIDLLFKK